MTNWLNPRCKAVGLQWWHYLTAHIVIIVAVLVAYFAGLFTVSASHSIVDRIKYVRDHTHFQSKQPIPMRPRPAIVPPVGTGHLAASGGIFFRFWGSVYNQGNLLSCAAQAFAETSSYAYNRQTGKHYSLSSRFLYDDVAGGRNVTTSISDYAEPARERGNVQRGVFGYGTQAPRNYSSYGVEPIPGWVAAKARRFRRTFGERILWYYQGPGYGGVQRARAEIAQHHPVAMLTPIFHEAMSSAWLTGYYEGPLSGDWNDGGHIWVAVRYNDHKRFPDGSTGGFLFAQSYGPLFGVDRFGNVHRGHGGFVWVPYHFVSTYSAWAVTVSFRRHPRTARGGGSFHYYPSHARLTTPPYDPGEKAVGGAVGYWVHNVHLNNNAADTDISVTVNDAAAAYRISPVGLASMLATESGLRQYAPHYPIAGAGGCDYSFGMSQITVCTAAGLGVGDGSLSAANINYVANYEQADYRRAIWLGAKLLGQFKAATCVDFYALYVVYNAGPGYGCGAAFYWSPTGLAYSNLWNNFMPWFRYATVNWASSVRVGYTPPAPPKPPRAFNTALWNHYRLAHRLRLIPYRLNGKRTWAASIFYAHPRLGGVKAQGTWNPGKRRGRGFMLYPFTHGRALAWPAYHRYKLVR